MRADLDGFWWTWEKTWRTFGKFGVFFVMQKQKFRLFECACCLLSNFDPILIVLAISSGSEHPDQNAQLGSGLDRRDKGTPGGGPSRSTTVLRFQFECWGCERPPPATSGGRRWLRSAVRLFSIQLWLFVIRPNPGAARDAPRTSREPGPSFRIRLYTRQYNKENALGLSVPVFIRKEHPRIKRAHRREPGFCVISLQKTRKRTSTAI